MSANAPQGAPNPNQQIPISKLIRPEQLGSLTWLDDSEKAKYGPALRGIWTMINEKPQESQEYKQSYQKLVQFTQHIQKTIRQRQQAGAGGQKPSQGQSQDQSQQSAQPQQAQAQAPQAQSSQPAPAQARPAQQPNPQVQQQQQQIQAKVAEHVSKFQFTLPPNFTPGTEEAQKQLKELKDTYSRTLAKMEHAAMNAKRLNSIMQQRTQSGQEISPDLVKQHEQQKQIHDSNKAYAEEFRKSQNQYRMARQAQQQAPEIKQEVKQENNIGDAGMSVTSQPQPQQLSQNQSSPQMAANPALGAAQIQANQNRNSGSPAVPGQPSQQPPNFPQQQQVPPGANQQMGQPPPFNLNSTRPQLNPQQNSQMNQQGQQNSPHPQSATTAGPPIPLTHQAAVNAAQRTHSDQRTTPQLPQGQGGYQIGNRDNNVLNQKMPIPKTINLPPPQPVNMGPGRPTMGGPGNGAPGMMGQPVINRQPQFTLEGEGDRVLSKKKLDELIRQVTAGGEGAEGDTVTPEVEDALLQLADDFVDNLITSACRVAKLRDSPTLEIRDIQLILERNYNIRIPGYASDEVRTVRKFQPAAGWTQKMNAIHSAKVDNTIVEAVASKSLQVKEDSPTAKPEPADE